MKRTFICFLLPFLLFTFPNLGRAQLAIIDSAFSGNYFHAGYALQFPGGDLVDRFGTNSNLCLGLNYKTDKNWLFGLQFDYLFGDKVKENHLFDNISTADGWIIDGDGIYADIFLFERGYFASGKLGKIFPFFSPNPNSGLLISGGGGYFQHKIRIENAGNVAPQVKDDYKRGYDRLTRGFGISEFIGYAYFGKTRIFNFYGGIEFFQSWTKSARDYNFDTRSSDHKQRFDNLWGFRVGWMIPFNKRSSQQFYYY